MTHTAINCQDTERKYIKNGEMVYCTGAYLKWDKKKECWVLDEADGDIFKDGSEVLFDENWLPYQL